MYDDKKRSDGCNDGFSEGLQGFDSAVPVDENANEMKDGQPSAPENEADRRQQGYTVTPSGGYYSGSPLQSHTDEAVGGEPEKAAAEPAVYQNDARNSARDGAKDEAIVQTGDEADALFEAPQEAAPEQPEANQPEPSNEYHYSAAAGDIPFTGSEQFEQESRTENASGQAGYQTGQPYAGQSGSWQSQSGAWQQNRNAGQQAGGSQTGGSYTPPQYGFMPNGNYGYQNPQSPYGSRPAQPVRPPKAPKPKKEKKPSERKFTAKVFVACVLAAVIVGAGAGAGSFALTSHLNTPEDNASSPTSSGGTTPTQNINIQGEVENLVQAVAEKVGPSVVGIRTTAASNSLFGGQSESSGEGSGIIYSEDGYIITNYHVIQAAAEQSGRQGSKVSVYLPSDSETPIDATIVGYNISYDLAVLKINKTGLPAAEIGNSDELSVGQYVVAIGNPGGLDFMGSVTYGVISGLNRKITTESSTQLNLIQTDAAINPGNSGGALVNSKGQIIGVNSVKLVSTGYESMGFAIPINEVIETCKNIISKENEPTPYLGLEISTTYDAQSLQMLGYPTGAVVQNVTEGGPAADAGIQRADIITEFDGTTISSYTTLSAAISQCEPGQQVSVKVYRSGRYYTANVTLGSDNVQTAQ